MDNFIDIKAIVHGQVQGVGFRATTRHHAKNLKLTGTVRNAPDGTVEICVKGPKENIDQLLYILQKQEFPGYISEIITKENVLDKSINDFLITH